MQCRFDLFVIIPALGDNVLFVHCMVHSGCSVHILFVLVISSHILHCLGPAMHSVVYGILSGYIHTYIPRHARDRDHVRLGFLLSSGTTGHYRARQGMAGQGGRWRWH